MRRIQTILLLAMTVAFLVTLFSLVKLTRQIESAEPIGLTPIPFTPKHAMP